METELAEFIERWLQSQASFRSLCAHYGISRKTGYKWVQRFKAEGKRGLGPRSRRPLSNGRAVGPWLIERVQALRREHGWGPKKLRVLLRQQGVSAVPAASTLGDIIRRAGLVRPRRRGRGSAVRYWPLGATPAQRANHIWTVDFKGWFCTLDGQRCDVLTVRDAYSRYVLAAELVGGVTHQAVRRVLHRLFQRQGLPERIRVDNGAPFGSPGPAGLSQLSVWWLALGVGVEFSRPGKPQDNGGHERMHRDLKAAVASPPARDRRSQRQRLVHWCHQFNTQRPHEALQMKTPASRYGRSARRYRAHPPPWSYPGHYATRRVSRTGEIKWCSGAWFIGAAFAGQRVGLLRVSGEHLEVYFQTELLGRLSERQARRFEPRLRARRKPSGRRAAAEGDPSAVQPPSPGEGRPTGSPACTAVSPNGRALTRKKKSGTTKVLPMSSV